MAKPLVERDVGPERLCGGGRGQTWPVAHHPHLHVPPVVGGDRPALPAWLPELDREPWVVRPEEVSTVLSRWNLGAMELRSAPARDCWEMGSEWLLECFDPEPTT